MLASGWPLVKKKMITSMTWGAAASLWRFLGREAQFSVPESVKGPFVLGGPHS
jgi:hypothetical protein